MDIPAPRHAHQEELLLSLLGSGFGGLDDAVADHLHERLRWVDFDALLANYPGTAAELTRRLIERLLPTQAP